MEHRLADWIKLYLSSDKLLFVAKEEAFDKPIEVDSGSDSEAASDTEYMGASEYDVEEGESADEEEDDMAIGNEPRKVIVIED